ncbi:MAG: hypothetical protein CK425_11260 [Parachlamydia sp.]|nr:MAG: hypothetical protein CK425_11260 [Parachlamydia sp.]
MGNNIIAPVSEENQLAGHEEFIRILEENKTSIGTELFETIYKFTLLKAEIAKPQRPHTSWQIIEAFMSIVATQDPTWFHFDIARKVLEHETPDALNGKSAVDILARELVEKCKELKALVKCPTELQSIKGEGKKEGTIEILEVTNSEPNFENLFINESFLNWDREYIKLISSIGAKGKEFSQKLSDKLSHENNKNFLSFWFEPINKSKKTYFFHSPAFIILGEVLWTDVVKTKWERQTRHTPAIAKGVLITTIKPPLSKDTKIEVKDSMITCYSDEGKIISTVPCIDPKLVNLICKGMQAFSSLCGHKLLRWQVQTGFRNWVEGNNDPRLICTSGGYQGIANLIGCGASNKSPSEVKAILHAQAFGQFNFPQGGTGNMIILREIEKYRNGEPSKINIILGEMLLPNFTHLMPAGEKRRLVPITDLPPLIGSKNTHAAQAMLQILILEEFSNQSDKLASSGSILLPISKWKELAHQANLAQSYVEKIIAGWTEDDLFSKAFLQKQGDEYTLGPSYSLVTNFLEYQGKQRIEGSKGGYKSAELKKELAARKYSKAKSKQNSG